MYVTLEWSGIPPRPQTRDTKRNLDLAVRWLDEDGRPFDPAATYTVAINSYRATGGGGHVTKGTGLKPEQLDAITLSSTVKDLRYYLMKWIEQQKVVTPKALGNWKVVPTEWWEKAKAVDYGLLYEGKRLP